jgi:hypothetical protein
LEDRYCLELRLWRFDLLRIPELKGAAATDAARADMILIATRGAGELPAEVKAWIEVWLAQKGEVQHDKCALAALFDVPRDKVEAASLAQFAYLQHVARKGSLDFFVSTLDQPGETPGFSRLQIAEQPGTATSRRVMLQENQHL